MVHTTKKDKHSQTINYIIPPPLPQNNIFPSLHSFKTKEHNNKKIRIIRKGNGKIINNKIIEKAINNITFTTINIRKGLVDKVKDLYHEIKENKSDIILLQEVGINKTGKRLLNKIFPGFTIFTNLPVHKQNVINGSQLNNKKIKRKVAKRGVAILVDKKLSKQYIINRVYIDYSNRALFLHIKNENHNLIVGNIYAPAEGKVENEKWIKKITPVCNKLIYKYKADLLLGGDWNIKLNKWPDYFYNFIEKIQLQDLAVFRDRDDCNTYQIWRKNKKVSKRLDGWFGTNNLAKIINEYFVNKNSDINSDHKPVHLQLKWDIEKEKEEFIDPIILYNKRIKKIVKNMKKEEWKDFKEKNRN